MPLFQIRYSVISRQIFETMSDDDEVPQVKRARIFYGSLEEKEKERLSRLSRDGPSTKDAVKAGIDSGHINISSGKIICIICFEPHKIKLNT